MKSSVRYYNSVKEDNTDETFELVKKRLSNSKINKIVLASTTGETAKKAMNFFKNDRVKLVIIPHQFDFFVVDNKFPSELISELREAGHEVHFGTMLFHTEKLFGSNVPCIVANFLRCFCEGVKVCYEIVIMASDAGILEAGEQVIAIAGTSKGSDTALVMQSASSQSLNNLKVNEILCKPLNQI